MNTKRIILVWKAGFRPRIGFGLIETLISFALFMVILGIAVQVVSAVRIQSGRDTVHLRNLQEARLAVSTLRRDFFCSCPVFSKSDTGQDRERIRRQPIQSLTAGAVSVKSMPISVGEEELVFYRNSKDRNISSVEPVRYSFDKSTGSLTRATPKQTTVFHGLQSVKFKVYVEQANPTVPLLWVHLEIRQSEPGVATGPLLVLSTTMASVQAADTVNHPEWHLLTAASPTD
ncbi:MAG: hypothetical protein WA705_09900 [Candidatus Ozemobacteraceae bacterium]